MFQMWGKLVENNHILQDLTVCIDDEDTRTHKVFRALDEICDAWNLAKPIQMVRLFRSAASGKKR